MLLGNLFNSQISVDCRPTLFFTFSLIEARQWCICSDTDSLVQTEASQLCVGQKWVGFKLLPTTQQINNTTTNNYSFIHY